jgi:hypothetical protein
LGDPLATLPMLLQSESAIIMFKEIHMNIYRFRPRTEGLNSPHWLASTYKGACLVYADTVKEAIQFANLEFGNAVCKPWPDEQPSNPWAKDDLVMITEAAHLSGPLPPRGTVMI